MTASVPETASGSVLLTHPVGLHARPSVKLTKLAKTFDGQVLLAASQDGPWIDAKSINKVMAARIPKDTVLCFHATGPGADEAVAALVDLVERNFGDADGAAAP